jgi:hypothetical protein
VVKGPKKREGAVPSPDALFLEFDYPVFCFKNCVKGYCLDSITDKKVGKAFIQKISKWSQMTWAQIMLADRQGLGHEEIAQDSLRVSLPACVKDDTTIVSTYLGKKVSRMAGFKKKEVFHVIAIGMDIYKH